MIVVRELRRSKNLSDLDIRNEFLELLQQGYVYLSPKDQENLVKTICQGLPDAEKQRISPSMDQESTEDHDGYVEGYEKRWIRDRLGMLKEHLEEEQRQLLSELIEALGEPDYPNHQRRSFEMYTVTEVSPIPEQSLAAMTPQDLMNFIAEWQPEPEHQSGKERITQDGLARAVANVMFANIEIYRLYIVEVALQRYQYANAFLGRLRYTDIYPIPWDLRIELCEKFLESDVVRSGMGTAYDGGWVGVRQGIIHLVESWFDETDSTLPLQYLPHVRDMLLILIDDPDPELETKQFKRKPLKESDPFVFALNQVRPSALMALIKYAMYKAKCTYPTAEDEKSKGPGPKRLERVIEEVLTRKLDRKVDPCWTVHLAYGRYLPLLYWLDKEWVETHIDEILPEGDDEESLRLFVATWDCYVKFNSSRYITLFERLRPKYELAINNLSKELVTRTCPEPGKDLARHLLIQYLKADYDLRSPVGQESLIASYFNKLTPVMRAHSGWVLFDICNTNQDKSEAYWSRARALWQWRIDVASASNYAAEFDEEMNWFSLLLKVASKRESLASLLPLLEGIVPHIARSESRSHGWRILEEYLSEEVERDPKRAIQLYFKMHYQRRESAWIFFPDKEARKIVNTALTSEEAKQEALDLIDLLGQNKNFHFQDLYKQNLK